jgi:hypothetical protein
MAGMGMLGQDGRRAEKGAEKGDEARASEQTGARGGSCHPIRPFAGDTRVNLGRGAARSKTWDACGRDFTVAAMRPGPPAGFDWICSDLA